MKKLLILFLSISLLIFTGCSKTESTSEEKQTIKVGISGGDERIWNYISKKAKEDNINIEVIRFSDYTQPNLALAEGEIDINAFQTVAFFKSFTTEHKLDLTPIGTTVLAPMGLYSEKFKNIKDLPDNAKIAVPDDVSNQGRALLLLEKAGLIKLKEGFNGLGGPEEIIKNDKNIEIIPLAAAQTPRALQDVDASIINNGIAVDAGFNLTDSIFHEDETATRYVNIIAANTKDKDRKDFKKIVEIYHSDDVKKFIEKEYDGNMVPTFLPLSEIKPFIQ